jgi:hypothetical protein
MDRLLMQYASRGVLLDTNILLILLAGLWDRNQLKSFRRNNQGYTAEDFDRLALFVGGFHQVWTTPHVLAEVSNLSDELSFKQKHPHLCERFRRVVEFLRGAHEEQVPKDTILCDRWLPLLERIGVTDLSIVEVARKQRCPVLTDDAKLEADLLRQGIVVVNFNNIRFPTDR